VQGAVVQGLQHQASVLPSGNVSFDAERTNRGHADRYWALVLACLKERGPARGGEAEVGGE